MYKLDSSTKMDAKEYPNSRKFATERGFRRALQRHWGDLDLKDPRYFFGIKDINQFVRHESAHKAMHEQHGGRGFFVLKLNSDNRFEGDAAYAPYAPIDCDRTTLAGKYNRFLADIMLSLAPDDPSPKDIYLAQKEIGRLYDQWIFENFIISEDPKAFGQELYNMPGLRKTVFTKLKPLLKKMGCTPGGLEYRLKRLEKATD